MSPLADTHRPPVHPQRDLVDDVALLAVVVGEHPAGPVEWVDDNPWWGGATNRRFGMVQR